MADENNQPPGQDSLNEAVNNDNEISNLEKTLLDNASDAPDESDEDLMRAQLDDVDEEGVPLNVEDPLTGADLDVPGASLDDAQEDIGSEDEENNYYSEAENE